MAAGEGDTIIIKDGEYVEHLAITKSLTLRSDSGDTAACVIRATAGYRVATVTTALDTVRIQGLTLAGGRPTQGDYSGYDIGAGILAAGTPLVLENVHVTDNRIPADQPQSTGGGVHVREGSYLRMRGCLVDHNYGPRGGGVTVRSAVGADLRNNVIADNTSDSHASGLWILPMPPVTGVFEVVGNTIAANSMAAVDGYGVRYQDTGQLLINNNIVAFNTGGGAQMGFYNAPSPPLSCNLVYPEPGYYSDSTYDAAADLQADPLFCDLAGSDYQVAPYSPALMGGCGQIGALGAGACGELRTLWVATDGDDVFGDGTRESPWATIQYAVDRAVDGETIALVDGVYTGPGNRQLDCGDKGLTIKSASGIPEACIVDAEHAPNQSIFASIWLSQQGPVLVEGLTLRNASQHGIRSGLPGARVSNCRFESCDTGYEAWSEVVLENCQFENCSTGLYLFYVGGIGEISHVRNSRFDGCGVGGYIYDSAVECESCVFTNGWLGLDGDVQARITVRGCEFYDNVGACRGCDDWNASSRFSIISSIIRNNSGDGVSGFTGIEMQDTEVVNNGGDGLSVALGYLSRISGCTIAGNGGAGLEFTPHTGNDPIPIIVENSTVAYNVGGGILITQPAPDTSVDVSNSLIAFNAGDGLADYGATYTNCVVYGNAADALADSWQVGMGGNFAKDPLICDAEGGDYGLAANSPCAPSVLHDLIGAQAVACAGIPLPVLLGVEDVPDDQGRQVRLTWYSSGYDVAGSEYPVLGYDLYRRSDAGARAVRPEPYAKLLGWDYVLRVPARGDQGYQVVAPTLCDAAADGTPCPSSFMVSAVTADPLVFFYSLPDSGTSVDNLAPGVPGGLAVEYAASGNHVSWAAPEEPDVARYEVWRTDGAAPGEDPGDPTTVLSRTEWLDTEFTGSAWSQAYWVAAVDYAGNRGPLTQWDSAGVSAVGDSDVPRNFALHGNMPNPFNPSTTLKFDLPRTARVDLAIYDVAGRRVRHLVAGETFPAGRHEAIWDGRDDAGMSVGSGVYLYRLDVGEYRETKRMTLIR